MKTKSLIGLFLLFSGLRIYSQELTFGLQTGADIVSIKSQELDITFASRLSYHIEAFGKYKLNRFVQIQVEPGYIEKGSWTGDRNTSGIYKYGYITIPTLLILEPINNLNLEFGPEISFLMHPKIKDSDGIIHDNIYLDCYNYFEIGGLAGISYSLLNNIQIGLRYGRGFTAIYDNVFFLDSIEPWNAKFFNRYLEIFTRISLIKLK
jgi:hypothetical protein